MLEIIGLIPARGGSERIPGKNLVKLLGKRLIEYTIEASRASRFISRTIVSTDDPEIARVARACGAEVPFMRPKRLATARAKSIDVVRHAARGLERHGVTPRAIVLLQPTSPLRTARDVDSAISLFLASRCDSVVSAALVSARSAACGFDFENAVRKRLLRLALPDGRLVAPGSAPGATTSAKARPCCLNGAVYVLGRRVFSGRLPIENRNTLAYIMPASRSVDIDEPVDLRAAERLAFYAAHGSGWDNPRHGRGGRTQKTCGLLRRLH